MAGIRGYHNYRGRTSKAKIALAVLLILVILCAIVVMLLQRHVVYDETGTPRLELPWQDRTAAGEEGTVSGELDLTIENSPTEDRQAERIFAFLIPVGILDRDRWDTMRAEMDLADPAYNAVAVTLKDDTGKVYFDAAAAQTDAVQLGTDTMEVLQEIIEDDAATYTIARLSCFHDPRAANSNVEELGLQNTGGFIFYDGNNSQWIDPAKSAARSYLCALAREAASMGFDEILLADVGYPTEGQLDKIAVGDHSKRENVETFLREMREVLEPYSVALSVEVSESVLAGAVEEIGGLTLRDAAKIADRIYAQVQPETVAEYTAAVTKINRAAEFVPKLSEQNSSIETSYMVFE